MVYRIRADIRKKTRIPALQLRVNSLLEIDFVDWIDKPKQISAKHLLEYIIQNIDWGKIRNRYVIEINPTAYFPNSNTPLILVCKYLNYGSLNIRGCFFLSNVFLKYQKNIYKYWALYRMKLQR